MARDNGQSSKLLERALHLITEANLASMPASWHKEARLWVNDVFDPIDKPAAGPAATNTCAAATPTDTAAAPVVLSLEIRAGDVEPLKTAVQEVCYQAGRAGLGVPVLDLASEALRCGTVDWERDQARAAIRDAVLGTVRLAHGPQLNALVELVLATSSDLARKGLLHPPTTAANRSPAP